MAGESANFGFLQGHDPQLVRLGALAERYFQDDPSTCLIKLRQFAERLAQLTAARSGLFRSIEESQMDLLRRLQLERIMPREVGDLFHQIRVAGNQATHAYTGDHREALNGLKLARALAIWFHQTFGADRTFKPGPFAPPPNPVAGNAALQAELDRLRADLATSHSEAERARLAAAAQAQAALSAEQRAQQAAADRALWEQLAIESDQDRSALAAELAALQAQTQRLPAQQTAQIISLAERAAAQLDLDEAATRSLIDQQLRDAGWLADSETLNFAQGTRPTKGQNLAIAEWPCGRGRADYALFIGTSCVGVIEAKRQRKNVSAAIDQAERYAKGIRAGEGWSLFGEGPWDGFQVPLAFATNGRPYLKQLATESGIWMRDLRRSTHRRRVLTAWPNPEELKADLAIDRAAADQTLKTLAYPPGLALRPYQEQAIAAIEQALAQDQRAMLVAMATGTGKTRLAIALLYRLLSAQRFRRICFVVDRSALGQQSEDAFRTTKMVSAKAFADIFGLQGLGQITPDPATQVQICTIQGLVKRVLYANDRAAIPPVNQYDLLVIDECHRGYLLDRELSDGELSFRNQEDYVSKYRRVLEHFDAVKIGLTATPALHTTQIFGEPIFKYSYRAAVIDGYLIDHEPPIQIATELSQNGIQFAAGEPIEQFNTTTGTIDLAQAADDLSFDVEQFNKKVITKAFNEAVAQELARQIDPSLPGKTLIFAANDAHADQVVEAVKQALEDQYGEIEDAAVRKITGSVDRVGDLIRSYRNDSLPKIAVTVDLLTTGIDIPKITNLVFLRRVNSRILYEQMLGRATRQCSEIEKETFRIFDAVDLYRQLQALTDMKPVVVNPTITLAQLFDELAQVDSEPHRAIIRDQIVVKLRQKLRRLAEEAQTAYEAQSGETPAATLERFRSAPLSELATWVRDRPGLGPILDWNPEAGQGQWLPISHHPDRVVAVTRGYGQGQKPADFLDSFAAYIRDNRNQIAALTVVLQRPRELTRAQLRELRQDLDRLGYSETSLRQAWRDTKNEDIAASIIGFIRQAALGDPLIPYDQRVKNAIQRIMARRDWTDPQRRWLAKIGDQMAREFVIDRAAFDQEPFRKDGGFTRFNRVFDGQLETLIGDIAEELWRDRA